MLTWKNAHVLIFSKQT